LHQTTKDIVLSKHFELANFLTNKAPKLLDNEFDPIIMAIMDARNHGNFECENYVLNELDNTLYNV
jgi:hypothetical protein